MAIRSRYRSIYYSTEAAPLAAFRVLFGIIIALSMLRFVAYGWVEKLYLSPVFHFTYLGFSWVQPLGIWTYGLFLLCFISAIGVALGYRYKLSTMVLFLSFTYIEAMDKTTYLNHYYFISIVALLLCFLPANATYSLDNKQGRSCERLIPKWTLLSIQAFIFIVYFYAGLAKLNSDWLFEAQPLSIWLTTKTDLPLIGQFFESTWVHYLFSWGGAIYDLTIPFLLVNKRTQKIAFVLVIAFHIMTRVLFPIGMFPWIMIIAATIFFPSKYHIAFLYRALPFLRPQDQSEKRKYLGSSKWLVTLIIASQIILPWRYLFYPGELFWHEQGFRFSWRVMLMEKQGYTTFRIVDKDTGESWTVQNEEFLSSFQEKQMAFQPDFILEYAHHLANHYKATEGRNISVYADSFVSLNGRTSKAFVDPTIDLITKSRNFQPIDWLLPFNDSIHGL
tara:strand:+ start:12341 stop:13681 length:1341 start_codon:yes stop_codon:yes gene_type:complete